ncbi:MAG: acyltransferase [Gammaproteobacteria bacterium]|nr:MAG: acyltransferase [Gammaproteobacteria bacterium]
MKYVNINGYRDDIDGLRAIAVLSVIFFHFGFLPNGYLGVDVFFVISGYLITGIIYNELNEKRFSIVNFYLRRTRRIIPLALFICLVSLVVGIATMLPDDLENLAQSIVATNLFSNNILQAITTKNYWDIANEYKPLMHTWSLGVEEQYYFLYPLLLLFIGKKRRTWILPLLIILTICSFGLSFSSYSDYVKFYHIPFRFYELSVGGIAAIYLNNKLFTHKFSSVFVIGLIVILFFNFSFMPNQNILLPITVLITLCIIASSNEQSKLSSLIFKNKLMSYLGVISFSLYMWHQVLLAFTRYFITQELELFHVIMIFIITMLLSVLSFTFIEQPFRNKNKINTKNLLLTLSIAFIVINSISLYIYSKAGVLKNIPELDITAEDATRNLHSKYNSKIYTYDRNFSTVNKIRVLVIGNSFARDWANVLLESRYANKLTISYIYDPFSHKELISRAQDADIIFYSTAKKIDIINLGIDESKLFVVGTKNFGSSSGIFYNHYGSDYFKQRTLMEKGYLEKNNKMFEEWGNKYIDYIAKVINEEKTVPVFTPDNKFISQDSRHFTKAGALYFAQLFDTKLGSIFNPLKSEGTTSRKHY